MATINATTEEAAVWHALQALEAGGSISRKEGWCLVSELHHHSNLEWTIFRDALQGLLRRRSVQVRQERQRGDEEQGGRQTEFVRSKARANRSRDLRGVIQ